MVGEIRSGVIAFMPIDVGAGGMSRVGWRSGGAGSGCGRINGPGVAFGVLLHDYRSVPEDDAEDECVDDVLHEWRVGRGEREESIYHIKDIHCGNRMNCRRCKIFRRE
jgi:hypothetical protein